MQHFRNKVKGLGSKSLLSVGIFFSLILLGSVGVMAADRFDGVLGTLYSTKNANKLSATMWDTLLGEVGGIGNGLDTLSGSTANQITALSGRVNTLSGKVTTLSGTVSGIVSSQRTTNGNNIYYTKGNVGIGTTSPTAKLQVAGNIIASDPTAANHVATKNYVDSLQPTINATTPTITNYTIIQPQSGKASYSVSNQDVCFVSGIMQGGGYYNTSHNGHSNIQFRTKARYGNGEKTMSLSYRDSSDSGVIIKQDMDDGADDPWACRVNRSSYDGAPTELVAIINFGNDSVACQFVCLKF